MMGWGGVGWGGEGHANVPCTSYVICCYAAEISGVLATVRYTRRGGVGWGGHAKRSLYFVRYMLLRCRDLWCSLLRCICCYEGVMMGWGGGGMLNVPCTSYVICCYAAEISGVVATLYVATLLFVRYMLLRCRDL